LHGNSCGADVVRGYPSANARSGDFASGAWLRGAGNATQVCFAEVTRQTACDTAFDKGVVYCSQQNDDPSTADRKGQIVLRCFELKLSSARASFNRLGAGGAHVPAWRYRIVK